MADPADIQRLIGDLAREGTIVSVDGHAGTCRVRFADYLTTGDVPWLAARVGKTRIWSPPSIGEQVVVLCPEADTARGIVIGSLSSDANPHPANDGSTVIEFGDGARIGYDPAGHVFTIALPTGATMSVVAEGGISLKGPLAVDGTITATDDVVGAGKSLKMHTHTGVQAGAAFSGPPR